MGNFFLSSKSNNTHFQEIFNILKNQEIADIIDIPTNIPEDFEDVSVNEEILQKGLECKCCFIHLAQVKNQSCNHKILCYSCLKDKFIQSPFIHCPIQHCNHKINALLI